MPKESAENKFVKIYINQKECRRAAKGARAAARAKRARSSAGERGAHGWGTRTNCPEPTRPYGKAVWWQWRDGDYMPAKKPAMNQKPKCAEGGRCEEGKQKGKNPGRKV